MIITINYLLLIKIPSEYRIVLRKSVESAAYIQSPDGDANKSLIFFTIRPQQKPNGSIQVNPLGAY
ncbi:hypothetical protein A9G09_01085 [Gilliamella sp. wkB292]|uniref:hypothetical protein n=1 Tax=Gilliamella sp. wkB292 TaxID=3120262 RepID=UPI00080DFAF1|nr:hypothetical protein [Gilliamella apicola]OCG17927.1 hypothetical protein A9G09_01085 [Gilliamella apicola]